MSFGPEVCKNPVTAEGIKALRRENIQLVIL
jgi:hypothetical protein